ncbi:hypothetical protein [Brachybacterium sp. YJGR34]|uniref:hypothetical protein n=1 Tax=Brachybacterium sp. YJGR34 TaxID=2059911 RepID=UPI000E0A2548|nr:hypothetical protein [Brachybacterium sp. YJGR34]
MTRAVALDLAERDLDVEDMGKHLDLLALGEVVELFAPEGREHREASDIRLRLRSGSVGHLRQVTTAG